MNKKLIVTALSGALFCGAANAQSFTFEELIQIGASLPEIGDIASGANLNVTSGTITLTDGSTLVVSTTDGQSLSQALSSNTATLLVDGNEVTLDTTATSLASAYDNPDQIANFTVSAIAETRPITLEWSGPLNAVETESTLNAQLNGTPVTLVLPEGTSLADFNGDTQITVLDANGNVILDGTFNTLSADDINRIASQLGVLNADKSLRAAQRQAMAQSFGILSNQIDMSMMPSAQNNSIRSSDGAARFGFADGMNAWVAVEGGNVSGDADGFSYKGDSRTSMLGVDARIDNLMLGVAAGYGKVEIDSRFGDAELKGNLIAPYSAVSLLDGNLVLSGILLYQDLEGSYRYTSMTNDWDGDRWGARAAANYYFAPMNGFVPGVAFGGAYMKDDLDDDQGNDIGAELGEVFAGANISKAYAAGTLYGSLTYFEDVTSDFDNDAAFIDDGDGSRTELKLGATHQWANGVNLNVSARTTLGSNDTEYDAVQATLGYQF
jgi:outer membrane autotransporter protein